MRTIFNFSKARVRKIFLSIFLILVFMGNVSVLADEISEEQVKSFDKKVQFSASGGLIYFFDEEAGSLYLYNSSTGRLMRQYNIDELGKNLKKE